MKKRIVSSVLALALTIALAPQSLAAGFEKINAYADGKFSDVAAKDWFSDVVASSYELGLMKGSSENIFNPSGNISVAETVALAARIHNIANGGDGEFEQGSPWYKVYADYALEKKMIKDTYKDYNVKISRANFAFILANALPEEDLEAINDVPEKSLPDVADDYKAGAIYKLYRAGVLTGSDEFGTFNPDSTITRAEVAAIVSRMADKAQRKKLDLKRRTTVSAEIFRGAIAYADMAFAQNYGISLAESLDKEISYGMTGAEILKQQALSMVTEFESVRLFAIENGISFNDADKKEIEAAKEQEYMMSGGKAAFLENLKAQGLNEAFYNYLLESQLYYNKLTELFGEGGKYGADKDAIAEVLSQNYIRVKHILIQAEQGSADYKEKEALAKKILQKISRGEDFEKLLKEYGEDPGMQMNTDGYIFDSYGYTPDGSQMISEFVYASAALKVGSVSEVVPSAYGFHIIKRYPIDQAFIDSFLKSNEATFTANGLANTVSGFMGKVVISNRAELEKTDVYSVFGK